MMGLRLSEGIGRAAFRRELEADLEDLLEPARLSHLQEAGLVSLDAAGLRATAAGRQRLDGVLDYLLAPVRPAAVN
jgi:oxygen-independent coproporphyrinogen-3 oxidase